MMKSLSTFTRPLLALALAAAATAACGDDDGGGADAAESDPDGSAGGPDAAGQPDIDAADQPDIDAADQPDIDAGPTTDAMPQMVDLSCIGAPSPTEAVDPLTLTGVVSEVGLGGKTPVADAVIEAYLPPLELLASDSSASDGSFVLNTDTGGEPLDAFARASKATYMSTWLYPPDPLTENLTNVPMLLISESNVGLLELLLGITIDEEAGIVSLIVLDCAGNPVQGAMVTTDPAGPAWSSTCRPATSPSTPPGRAPSGRLTRSSPTPATSRSPPSTRSRRGQPPLSA
jgi:hypothetical protein